MLHFKNVEYSFTIILVGIVLCIIIIVLPSLNSLRLCNTQKCHSHLLRERQQHTVKIDLHTLWILWDEYSCETYVQYWIS